MKIKNVFILILTGITLLYAGYVFIFQAKVNNNAKESYLKNIDIFYRKSLNNKFAHSASIQRLQCTRSIYLINESYQFDIDSCTNKWFMKNVGLGDLIVKDSNSYIVKIVKPDSSYIIDTLKFHKLPERFR